MKTFEPVDYEEMGDWVDCWNCGGEGFSHHDCGEDCCCCLHPEDNVVCDICRGKGGHSTIVPREDPTTPEE